jgi:hypothetical protein
VNEVLKEKSRSNLNKMADTKQQQKQHEPILVAASPNHHHLNLNLNLNRLSFKGGHDCETTTSCGGCGGGENLTSCSLCNANFSLINEPKLIPCGENVCKNCLSNNFKSLIVKNNSSFKCPVCYEQHVQPPDGFITNKMILKLAVEKQTEMFTRTNTSGARSYEILDQFEQIANDIYASLSELVNLKTMGLNRLEQNCRYVRREIGRKAKRIVDLVAKEEKQLIKQIDDYEQEIVNRLDDNQIINEINEINTHVTQYIGQVESNLSDSLDTFIVYSNTKLVEDATRLKESMNKLEKLIMAYRNSISTVRLVDCKIDDSLHDLSEKRLHGCLGMLKFDKSSTSSSSL